MKTHPNQLPPIKLINKPSIVYAQASVMPFPAQPSLVNIAAHTDILKLTPILVEQKQTLLSDIDIKRLEGLHGREHRIAQLLASRHLLNKLHLERTGQTAKVRSSNSGAPYIDNSILRCSIAHSNNAVVTALSTIPVGIDIEVVKPRDIQETAKLFMSSKDQETFRTLNPGEQQRFFYQQWCRVESVAKLKDLNLGQAYQLLQEEPHSFSHYERRIGRFQMCLSCNTPVKIQMNTIPPGV